MRRTTICRSSGPAALAAAALLAASSSLSAQDTTAVAQDTMVLSPDSGMVLAQDPAMNQDQPRVHVVRGGETLWTLAEFYLGDPYLWPEIYRLNTLVVEDPHWIFPGEQLLLIPPDTTTLASTLPDDPPLTPQPGDTLLLPPVSDPELEPQVTEAPPPPPPPSTAMSPTVFRSGPETRLRRGMTVVRTPPARPTGRLAFYSAGFLTEDEQLPWGEVLGAVDRPTLSTLNFSSAATVYEEVSIRAPENATYHVGDSLVVSRLSRQLASWGKVVVPTGIVRVVAVEGRNVRAEVTMQFGRVADGQVALPVTPVRDRSNVRAQPIENGMRGSIIAGRDLHPVPGLQDVIFIDRGRADGVVPGDVFEVVAPNEDGAFADVPAQRIAVLEVAHVRERSASGVIRQITSVGIRPGAPVRLVRKMPS